MEKNEEFLRLYKKLESILEGIYPKNSSDSPFWVQEMTLKRSDALSKRMRGEKYAVIRQIRNILAHREFNLSDPFVVGDETIEFLNQEIEILMHRKTAMDVAVPYERLVFANMSMRVTELTERMIDKGVTNAPVLRGRQVIGIFNGHALMLNLKMNQGIQITKDTRIEEIKDYLYLNAHAGIRYLFVKKDAPLDELDQLFKRSQNGKTELLIVTDSGDKYGDILGVISPHDILNNN